jgi:hypothetical protein
VRVPDAAKAVADVVGVRDVVLLDKQLIERRVGLRDSVAESLIVAVFSMDTVADNENGKVSDADIDGVEASVSLREYEREMDADAVEAMLKLPDELGSREVLTDVEAVGVRVGGGVLVRDSVSMLADSPVLVFEALFVMLAGFEAENVVVRDGDSEAVFVLSPVIDGVAEGAKVRVGVGGGVTLRDRVRSSVNVGDNVLALRVSDARPDNDSVLDPLLLVVEVPVCCEVEV